MGNIGTVRRENGRGIYKITLDKNLNENADHLKGSWLWHLNGTHDKVPPFATMLKGASLPAAGNRLMGGRGKKGITGDGYRP